jgi:hypothetical protein
MKSFAVLLMLSLLCLTVFAQTEDNKNSGFSAFLGGLSDFKDGAFVYGGIELGLARNLSFNLTLHQD